jgi:hypothetical protein
MRWRVVIDDRRPFLPAGCVGAICDEATQLFRPTS